MTAAGSDLSRIYERMGGESTFTRLVEGFYRRVREDAVLAPMYPQDDWAGAEHRLATFLMQYWGGPTTYSEERGHPMLRRRHVSFHIGPTARDQWLSHMRASLDELDLDPSIDAVLWDYLKRAAFAMQNAQEDS